MANPVISLEQFAAIESWMEALFRYALKHQADNHAPLITDIYRHRQRAMVLLTGAKFPAADKDDEARFKASLEELIAQAKQTGRAHAPKKPIVLPTSKSDADDPHGVG